jgi:hypothetical protein
MLSESGGTRGGRETGEALQVEFGLRDLLGHWGVWPAQAHQGNASDCRLKKISEGEASVKEASGKAQESLEFGANLSSPNFFIFVSCP